MNIHSKTYIKYRHQRMVHVHRHKTETQQKRKMIKHCQSHLDNNVAAVTGLQVEVCDLRAQTSLHLFIHLVTGLHQLHSQIHVVPREAVVGPQCQGSWQEAHQVVLKGSDRGKGTIRKEGTEEWWEIMMIAKIWLIERLHRSVQLLIQQKHKGWLIQQGGHCWFWQIPVVCGTSKTAGLCQPQAIYIITIKMRLSFSAGSWVIKGSKTTQDFGEHLYHFRIEAVMWQLSNKGQSAGTRLSHKVFFDSFNSLKVVLQQAGQNRKNSTY